MSTFYTVQHLFDRKVGEEEMEYSSRLESIGLDARRDLGLSRVGYLPTLDNNEPTLCLWEMKDELTTELFDEMRKLVDPGPLGTVQIVHKVQAGLPGASVLPSVWGDRVPPRAAAPSTGSFFWVRHDLVTGASDAFWASMIGQRGFSSPYPDRVHNHCLLPTGVGELDPLFSIWETRDPMHADEFHGFIEGDNSPAPRRWLRSRVHQVQSSANPMSAVFRPRGFMSSAMMPLEDPMAAMMEPAAKASGKKSWLSRPDWLESDW